MDQNVVSISFAEPSKAYQALSEIKRAAVEQRLELANAAVVERTHEGQFQLKDGASDGVAGDSVLTGTLIGSLVGVLAGPLGVLLGGMTGALFGSAAAVDTAGERYSMLEQLMQSIPPGSTALIATVGEPSGAVIDQLAESLDGVVLRRPQALVQAEVEADQEAALAAAREARKVLREQRKEERHEKFDNWKEDMGQRIENLKHRIKEAFDRK